jgi:hypothetical protein
VEILEKAMEVIEERIERVERLTAEGTEIVKRSGYDQA